MPPVDETPSDLPKRDAPRAASTRLIHAFHGEAGAVVQGVERASTYVINEARDLALRTPEGRLSTNVYGRWGNPTTRQVAAAVAQLEGAEGGVLLASGMAAIDASLSVSVAAGGKLALSTDLYGGTEAVIAHHAQERALELHRFDPCSLDGLESALAAGARTIYCESVSNPLMRVADLPGIADLARRNDARFIVDATFTAGIAQRPLEQGADVVLHSVTKFLNGHSDLIGGAVVGDAQWTAALHHRMTIAGSCMDPHAAWLLGRGMRTLSLRYERQQANARALGGWLAERDWVVRVCQAEVGKAGLSGPGCLLSFELSASCPVDAFVAALELVIHAPSLGGLESLCCIPARSSHAALSADQRAKLGISERLVRLSVGAEALDDICGDLEQAAVHATRPAQG